MTGAGNVLITGGTMGIGYELAKLFARDGYNLVIIARDKMELDKVSKELERDFNVRVETIQKDLFDPNGAFEIYNECKAKSLDVDILVNNAGQGTFGKFGDTDLKKELAIIQLNIASVVVLSKLFLQDMLKKGNGKILNLSSVASQAPGPWLSVYHGTKAFVQSFSEALHYEYEDQGITVTALLPGPTDTGFFHKANMESSKVYQDKSKLADPADVAKDGYEALMKGDDKVVSGFKNKMQVGMNRLRSDERAAEKMAGMQKPVDEEASEE